MTAETSSRAAKHQVHSVLGDPHIESSASVRELIRP